MTTDDMNEADLFADLPPLTDSELGALRQRLAIRADSAGVLDVAYRTIDTPVGTRAAGRHSGRPGQGRLQARGTRRRRWPPWPTT